MTDHDDQAPFEEPEGLDSPGSAGWGEYPLDSVFVRTETRTVSEILKRIEAGRYELNPEFQRTFVWPLDKQSRLVESALMRIPLPVFYVAEAKDGKIVVVDGLQRLTTFMRYVNDEFALTGLGDGKDEGSKNNPLLGKKFSKLPINLQERIEDTQLTLYILDAKAPERAKLDIFERVNSGVPLARQQMRNCLYSGPATKWLREAADSDAFLDVTAKSLDRKSMRDREAINRFCAFRVLGYELYKGDMDTFLADALEKMNQLEPIVLESMMDAFETSMHWNKVLFERHAFRKSLISPNGARSVINISLFDVCSVLLADLPHDLNGEAQKEVRKAIVDLMRDEDFVAAISYSTNSTWQVRTRFQKVAAALREAI